MIIDMYLLCLLFKSMLSHQNLNQNFACKLVLNICDAMCIYVLNLRVDLEELVVFCILNKQNIGEIILL